MDEFRSGGKCCLYSEILHLFDVLYKMMVTLGFMTEMGEVVFVCMSLFDEIKGDDHISILQNFWKYH